jgi:putative membrane protein
MKYTITKRNWFVGLLCLISATVFGQTEPAPPAPTPVPVAPGLPGNPNQPPQPPSGMEGENGMNQERTNQQAALSPDERATLAKIMIVNNAEIKVGELAQRKAASEAARTFGNYLVQDHTTANDRLKMIGANMTPEDSDAEAKKLQGDLDKVYAKLEGAQQNAFDQAFAQEMLDGHQKVLTIVNQAETKMVHPETKDYLRQFKATVNGHIQMARDLMTNVSH